MNILYINHYAGSPDMGMEFRPYYFAKEWDGKNNNVRIVCASFSHLRRINPSMKKDFQIKRVDGVDYQFVKTCKYKRNGIKRVLSIYQFVSKLKKHAKKIVREFKPDIVICSSTYPFDTYAGRRIADLAKAKFVFEGHDLWPLTLIEIGGMSEKNPFIYKMKKAEQFAYQKSDIVVSLLPYSYEHMLENGLQSIDKFHHISNGIALEDWNNPEPLPKEHEEVLNSLRKKGEFIVMFTGGHALSNMLDTFLDCASITREEKISYVLIGSGIEKDRLMLRKENEKLDNVYFLPPINKKAIPTALSKADALYIGADAPLYRFGVSINKVYDYMMSGKPIIYGVASKNNEVKDANAGVFFDFKNIDSLKKAIDKLKNMSEKERKQLGSNGQKWVKANCDYKILAEKFLSLMK